MIRNKREALEKAQRLWGPYAFCIKNKNGGPPKERYQVGAVAIINGKPEAAVFGFGRTSWDQAFADAASMSEALKTQRQEAIQQVLDLLAKHNESLNQPAEK